MSLKTEIEKPVAHQIKNLQTKIYLLKALPESFEIKEKIKLYSYQVKLREKLARINDRVMRRNIRMDTKNLAYLFGKIKESHKMGLIADADRQVEEELMAAIIANKHIAKTALGLYK